MDHIHVNLVEMEPSFAPIPGFKNIIYFLVPITKEQFSFQDNSIFFKNIQW